MAIVQISKIQQRSGNIVDLPQLDNSELGWASDARRLFIGNDNNTTGIENVEVLTSYSTIDFDQLNGAVGNLDIDGANLANGQIMTYDGNNWTNRGGDVGGLITLGDVSNVKIDGGAIGYVLETDGTGNLSWTPKSTIIAYVQNATQANPCIITTTEDNFFTEGQEVTFTNVPGMTQLNGNSYYANVVTSNTFSLYSDAGLTTPVNATGYGAFPYTSATATTSTSDQVTVGNATPFTLNDPVIFVGNTDFSNSGIIEGQTYYVKTKDTSAPNTWITLSETAGGSTLQLGNATFTTNVYTSGGRIIAAVGGAGTVAASGANTTVQFNNSNLLDGDNDFTWNFAAPKVLTINGNANVGNLNATSTVTSSRLISNITTGTAPLTVTSTTRVANLNVAHANVSDFEVITTQNTGTFYPAFVSAVTGNLALGANANLSFNAATGNLTTRLLSVTSNANVGNLGTAGLIVATGNVTGGNLVTGGLASVTGNVTGGNLVTGGVLSVTGNANVGNLGTAGLITATGNIQSTTFLVGANLSITGNANVGNLGTAGLVVATGNVTGGNLVTGGALSVTGNANVGNLGTGGVIVATGNVTGGNLLTGGWANVTGNVIGGNLVTSGVANVAGNVIAANLISGSDTGTTFNIIGSTQTTANTAGGRINVTAGSGNGTGSGGQLWLRSGSSAGTGRGGNLIVLAGTGGNGSAGGNVLVQGGSATGTDIVGGNVFIYSGSGTGNASSSRVIIGTPDPNPSGNTTQSLTYRVIIDDTTVNVISGTNSTSTTTGALVVGGGAGIAGNVYVGSALTVTGTTTSGNFATAGSVTASTLVSNVANGTAPLTVTSTTKVDNLNADLLDGFSTATAATANTVVVRDANGNITGNNISGTLSTAAQTNITSLGTLTSIIVSGTANLGTALTTILTSGSNSTAGTITGNWTLSSGSKLQATYADLAEYYAADAEYEPGTVLEFGGEQEVTLGTDGSNRVAGVVSTNPAYAMNAQCAGEFPVAIALQGRVPVKVRGNVRKGDMIVSGGNGYARPSSAPLMGTVIGKSLENFSGTDGIIEIAVGRL